MILKCLYCLKEFKREKSLINHKCKIRNKIQNIDSDLLNFSFEIYKLLKKDYSISKIDFYRNKKFDFYINLSNYIIRNINECELNCFLDFINKKLTRQRKLENLILEYCKYKNNICKFCGKFSRKNINKHFCEEKIKYIKNTETSKKALDLYKIFSKRQLIDIDGFFKNRKMFNLFIKFCEYCAELDYYKPEKFLKYLMSRKIKAKMWFDDSVYKDFLINDIKTEEPFEGLERTFYYIKKWAQNNDSDIKLFFKNINTNLLVHYILLGKISPWVLFNCKSGREKFYMLSEDQLNIIKDIIDLNFWLPKIKINTSICKFIEKELERLGL